jgi:nucleoside-diphosphate-sugar epimerase
VAPAIVAAPTIAGARNEVFNIGSDEAMTILELAKRISGVMGVPLNLDMLPGRREVQHAHCSHGRAQAVFSEVNSQALSIQDGLVEMADHVKSRPVPKVTECPAPIEIVDNLPMSWRNRLGL